MAPPIRATPDPATDSRSRSQPWISPSLEMFVAMLVLVGSAGCGGKNPDMKSMPQVEVIGVYPVVATEPVSLVEMRFRGLDGVFNVGEITQEIAGQPRSTWQVPYDERILNASGDRVLAEGFDAAEESDLWKNEMRMVFFFHHLELKRPLQTPFG